MKIKYIGDNTDDIYLTDGQIDKNRKKIQRENDWLKIQRFLALQLIPFVVISIVVGCFVYGFMSALVYMIHGV